MKRAIRRVSILLVVLSICSAAQVTKPKQVSPLNPTEPPKTEEGMIAFLLPDDVAYPDRLKEVSREVAVQALTKAQIQAKGARTAGVAYLLLILGQEPVANHQVLINALRSCVRDSETCDEHLIPYMSDLFLRNDHTMLAPLLDASNTTDATVSEILGSSYQDMLIRDPRLVVAEISRRSVKEQARVCHIIAAGDGSGFPEESLADVSASLAELSRLPGPTAGTAMTCLTAIRAFVPR